MRARKRFGQHFLQQVWADKLVAAIDPKPDQAFVEIGPGQGALTFPLARRVRRLLAIEIDRDLAGALRARAPSNLTIVTADFLNADLRVLIASHLGSAGPVRAAGNLPYNVGSPILIKLLKDADRGTAISDATLMLQREVADRLMARPRTREYGVLTVLTRLHADVRPALSLPPAAFRPVPKVSSTAIHLTFRAPAVDVDEPAFTHVVKTIFQQRRKTLLNAARTLADKANMPAAQLFERADIDPGRRPETLDLEELARLTQILGAHDRPSLVPGRNPG